MVKYSEMRLCVVVAVGLVVGSLSASPEGERRAGVCRLAERYASTVAAACDGTAGSFRASLLADGSWPDVDYADRSRSSWKAAEHLKRLCVVAADWRRHSNRASLEAAHRALGCWLRRRLMNPNWWFNVIYVPSALGNAALMMDGELTDEECANVIARMSVNEPNFAKTGQNLFWMAENRLRRGLLCRNQELVRLALADMLSVVRVSDREGIRSDWCFHQHGRQPQFGNYGLAFLCDQARLTTILSGTDFPYPADKFDLVGKLAENGFAWVTWKGRFDVSAMGRQLNAGAQAQKCAAVERAFHNLEKSGWRRPSEPHGFRYFDKSAYAVYRTTDWMASVRASTPHIIGVETGVNEDNTKGMCMADGALMTYVTGREYEDVFPLWDDWRMIPGVTAYAGKPVGRGNAQNRADDIRAAATDDGGFFDFTFSREGLTAHKRWTFSSDGVLCEGSDIGAADGAWEVVTCVEHAIAAPDAGVVYRRDGESCFRNGQVLYTVYAPKDAIRFEVASRQGDFNTFMLAHPSHPTSGRVFSLRISHGRAPKGGRYRYRIAIERQKSDKSVGRRNPGRDKGIVTVDIDK